MRKAYLVAQPVGAGKTRLVLRKILRGAGKDKRKWNQRVERTLIVGPNIYVHRVWLRELLLLAHERGFVKGVKPEEIRTRKVGWLTTRLKNSGLKVPVYSTYSKLYGYNQKRPPKHKNVRRWHYLVFDEWHRIHDSIRKDCIRWRNNATKGSAIPWYVGGRAAIKAVFFVSATPVNPVLENEERLNMPELSQDEFAGRVTKAIARAGDVLQGMVGRRLAPNGKPLRFFELVRCLDIEVLESTKKAGTWKRPTPAAKDREATRSQETQERRVREQELELIAEHTSNDNKDGWSAEYTHMVGLVRTKYDHGRGRYCISRSAQGPHKRCFGFEYTRLYLNAGSHGTSAEDYIRNHPRFIRLLQILQKEKVVIQSDQSTYQRTKKKVLVFCAHRGVANGLVEALNELLGKGTAATNVSSSHGKTSTVDQHTDAFNKKGTPPYILVATDILSESIDLHWACKLLVHYELPWSPLRLYQRVGRLTRRMGTSEFNKNVKVGHIIIPGSVEEERVNRLIRRICFLHKQELLPSGKLDVLAHALIGGGPSLHLKEIINRRSA